MKTIFIIGFILLLVSCTDKSKISVQDARLNLKNARYEIIDKVIREPKLNKQYKEFIEDENRGLLFDSFFKAAQNHKEAKANYERTNHPNEKLLYLNALSDLEKEQTKFEVSWDQFIKNR